MQTNELVKTLAGDLKAQSSDRFYRQAFWMWAGGTLALLGLSFLILPIRPDLSERIKSLFFDSGTFLCFITFLATAYVAYRSSIPGLLQKREVQIAQFFIVALVALLISKFPFGSVRGEWNGEFSFYRGGCGPLIFMLGAFETTVAILVARRGATTEPVRTGLWIALSAGALGLFIMQFICEHETFFHLLLWHAIPVGLLAVVGALIGRKWLRW